MVLQKMTRPSKISLVKPPAHGDTRLVNKVKNLLLFSTLIAGAASVHGQNTFSFEFTADSVGNYRQSPSGVAFDGGTFDMEVRDGNFTYDGCEDFLFYRPSTGCPLGATGWVSRGIENDPLLRGLGPYFSINSISAATLLRPFDPNAVRLVSAPPSLLPRPLGGFNDLSLNIFFNLQTPLIRQYLITQYDFTRQYTSAERGRFDGEIVPGTYIYNFPSLASDITPVVLSVNQFPKLDGFRKINSQKQGFRFIDVTYDDGFAVLNPFELNVLKWEGNTNSLIFPSVDNLFFSIKPLANPIDPLSDPVQYNGLGPFVVDGDGNLIQNPTLPIFPNFLGASISRVLLPSPLDTSYILPPNFIDPGQTGVMDMEFVIFRPTSAVIYENSIRRFRLAVKVLNPFESAIIAALPPNATSAQRAADFDYDGDGVSNFTEWVFKSNPALKSSVPGSPVVGTVNVPAASATKMESKATSSQTALQYKVAKLINSIPKLKYTIEYSPNMTTWQAITASDPTWIITETESEIKVTSSGLNQQPGGFFRTKVQAL
jgi:hypothetical protein